MNHYNAGNLALAIGDWSEAFSHFTAASEGLDDAGFMQSLEQGQQSIGELVQRVAKLRIDQMRRKLKVKSKEGKRRRKKETFEDQGECFSVSFLRVKILS